MQGVTEPRSPFVVRASGRQIASNIATERGAALLAFRTIRRGSSLADVVDADGWVCNIYARSEPTP